MRTTDNNNGKKLSELQNDDSFDINDLKIFSNRKIGDLLKDNPNFLIFPRSNVKTEDGIESQIIFELSEAEHDKDREITTHNIMGFIGYKNTHLTISSRFAKDKNDFFLHYMLCKVQNLNIMDFNISQSRNEQIYEFMPYLFPAYLKNAIKQGLFKEYKRNEYNNANLKGAIDVKRHLRLNIPFSGKIAYTMREHSFDNQITQLIRHTIEFIAVSPKWKTLLSCDSDMIDAVTQIRRNTPSYNKNDRQKVMKNNLKPFRHPYFSEYKPLRQISIQILQYEKLSYGKGKNSIYGLLFDGAWLWEEYLNTLVKDKFYHPRNKSGENGYKLFEKTNERIFPDFVSKEPPYMIADAKYKHLERKNNENKINRDYKDYYQVMAYMYRFNSTKGFLMYPHSGEMTSEEKMIRETTGTLTLVGFGIPEDQKFIGFSDKMKVSEEKFKEEMCIDSVNHTIQK